MKIVIGADLVPTKTNEGLFINGDIKELIGEKLESILSSADFRVFNLETPLCDSFHPIKKYGPNLFAKTKTITGIKKMNVNLISLANNHIMDQGTQGLVSTTKILSENAIDYFGVGDNKNNLKKSFIYEKNNTKVGFYNCCEHEFSFATSFRAGANPFDPLDSFDDVQKLKNECDHVIVIFHGGKEHYRYPSPNLQRIFRKFADYGADLVIAQHTHCIGCCENYNDSILIYGQGNFIFDYLSNEYWNSSLLLLLDVDKQKIDINYIPIIKNGNAIKFAEGKEGECILSDYCDRSKKILSDGFIEKEFSSFVQKIYPSYMASIFRINNNYLYYFLNKLFKGKFVPFLTRRKLKKLNGFALRDYLLCETHYEIITWGDMNE